LELSIRFGKTLLLQELDSIESVLMPMLRRDLVHQGPRWVVMIGDKAVDFNEGFRIFLTTRNSAILLPPHTESLL
jgi:dynein heavy chain 2